MYNRIKAHHISFKNAANGIIWAFKTQPNFLIHSFLSALAITAAIILKITPLEMILIVFCIVLGLIVEMINTAIEAMTDLITKDYRHEAKVAKDVSAGMMLLAAIGTTLVASYIFLPRFIALLIR